MVLIGAKAGQEVNGLKAATVELFSQQWQYVVFIDFACSSFIE
jgi:hypothetical protein